MDPLESEAHRIKSSVDGHPMDLKGGSGQKGKEHGEKEEVCLRNGEVLAGVGRRRTIRSQEDAMFVLSNVRSVGWFDEDYNGKKGGKKKKFQRASCFIFRIIPLFLLLPHLIVSNKYYKKKTFAF